MSLLHMTAAQATRRTAADYSGLPRDRRSKLGMAVDIGCLEGCVGSAAASNCAHCGNDTTCWSQCASPTAVPCVQRCLANT